MEDRALYQIATEVIASENEEPFVIDNDDKAEWNNKIYHKVNRYYPSSQLCNVCDYKNEDAKNLSVRFWICPECNTEHDRDKNASINILNQGLKEVGM